MARKRPSQLDWAQIRSDALDLPSSPGGAEPTERRISIEQVRSIVTATKGQTLSETEIGTLDLLINNALLFFFLDRDRSNALTAKQLTKAYGDFHAAIKTLEKLLPKNRGPLFCAISDKGDAFAKDAGPHPGLKPYKAGRASPPLAEQWLIFRSEERLDEFLSRVREVSSWMTGSFSPPQAPKGLSAAVWLIGENLPEIYERVFGKRYGNGESGPGHRFVQAVLEAADILTDDGKPFKSGTIKAYRARAIVRRSGK